MRQKRFWIYLLIQVLVILGVVAIFKLTEDVKQGSVLAGTLFVLMPLIVGLKEYDCSRFRRKIFFAGLLQFWILFALPILSLRLANWDQPFDSLSLFGIPAAWLHKSANTSYLFMMACTLLNAWLPEKHQLATKV